jgi:hypothetical protein
MTTAVAGASYPTHDGGGGGRSHNNGFGSIVRLLLNRSRMNKIWREPLLASLSHGFNFKIGRFVIKQRKYVAFLQTILELYIKPII